MIAYQAILRERLQARINDNLYRRLNSYHAIDAITVGASNGQTLVNFASNDYLGLTHHPQMQASTQETHQSGSGASRLVSGQQPIHTKVEASLANFFKRDAAITFSSGYVANLTILQALAQRNDTIVMDKLNHASLVDGGRLSDACLQRYPHNNLEHADLLLSQSQSNLKLLISDGVFSMDGDCANVQTLKTLASKHQAMLIVDDAHGIGVFGTHGQGITNDHGGVDLLIGTFGKAFGSAGAFAVGEHQTIDYLRNFARGFIYSTAVPPTLAHAQLTALKIVSSQPEHQQQLRQNIDYFKAAFKAHSDRLNLSLLPSDSAIQALIIGDNQNVLQYQEQLQSAGFLVGAMRPPTVPKNSARLRITISAKHQQQHINQLLETLITIQ